MKIAILTKPDKFRLKYKRGTCNVIVDSLKGGTIHQFEIPNSDASIDAWCGLNSYTCTLHCSMTDDMYEDMDALVTGKYAVFLVDMNGCHVLGGGHPTSLGLKKGRGFSEFQFVACGMRYPYNKTDLSFEETINKLKEE